MVYVQEEDRCTKGNFVISNWAEKDGNVKEKRKNTDMCIQEAEKERHSRTETGKRITFIKCNKIGLFLQMSLTSLFCNATFGKLFFGINEMNW